MADGCTPRARVSCRIVVNVGTFSPHSMKPTKSAFIPARSASEGGPGEAEGVDAADEVEQAAVGDDAVAVAGVVEGAMAAEEGSRRSLVSRYSPGAEGGGMGEGSGDFASDGSSSDPDFIDSSEWSVSISRR